MIEDKDLKITKEEDDHVKKISELVDAFFYFIKTNTNWKDLIETKYGNGKTLNYHFNKFKNNDVFKTLFEQVQKFGNDNKLIDYSKIMIDSTNIKNIDGHDYIGACSSDRGRNATKMSIICDKRGVPLSLKFFAGNVSDMKTVQETFNNYSGTLPSSSKKKPTYFLADRGYDSEEIRQYIRNLGYIPKIPFRRRRQPAKKHIDVIKPKRKYKKNKKNDNKKIKNKISEYQKKLAINDNDRNNIERIFGCHDNYKRLQSRWEKTIKSYEELSYFSLAIIAFNRMKLLN